MYSSKFLLGRSAIPIIKSRASPRYRIVVCIYLGHDLTREIRSLTALSAYSGLRLAYPGHGTTGIVRLATATTSTLDNVGDTPFIPSYDDDDDQNDVQAH